MNKKISPEELEKRTVESLWLNYFNRSLREQKIISEKEYRKMIELIAKKTGVEMRVRS